MGRNLFKECSICGKQGIRSDRLKKHQKSKKCRVDIDPDQKSYDSDQLIEPKKLLQKTQQKLLSIQNDVKIQPSSNQFQCRTVINLTKNGGFQNRRVQVPISKTRSYWNPLMPNLSNQTKRKVSISQLEDVLESLQKLNEPVKTPRSMQRKPWPINLDPNSSSRNRCLPPKLGNIGWLKQIGLLPKNARSIEEYTQQLDSEQLAEFQEAKMCAICYADLFDDQTESDQTAQCLNCHKRFHRPCLVEFYVQSRKMTHKCPYCKQHELYSLIQQ